MNVTLVYATKFIIYYIDMRACIMFHAELEFNRKILFDRIPFIITLSLQ